MASDIGAMFMEVSADKNLNIFEAFEFLPKALVEKQDYNKEYLRSKKL